MPDLITDAFGLQSQTAGTTSALSLSGELDLEVAHVVRDAANAALAGGCEILIIDLSRLSLLDVAGVRVLLDAHRHAQARGVRLLMIPARDQIQQIFRLCELDSALPFLPATRR